jgi:hypothetical protein
MNEHIDKIRSQAEFVGDRYALPNEFADEFSKLLLKNILDTIVELNINRCSYTTYDQSVQECARQEIIKGLAAHYDLKYTIPNPNIKTFPVKGSRS